MYRRMTGVRLTVASGAKLGWITGVFLFVMLLFNFTLGMALEPEAVEELRKQVMAQYSGPQADIDRLWDALADRPSACGWTRDRFGVVWHINYAGLPRLMTSQERINKLMAAMMTMVKIDVQKLEDAVA